MTSRLDKLVNLLGCRIGPVLFVGVDDQQGRVVWEGSGTMRCGARTVPLEAGDVVAKPAGSRLAIEFVAGPGGMTIFDIEGWRHFQQTDVVLYPDHQEWYLRGPGLEVVAPEAALLPAQALMSHYEEDYRRDLQGNRVNVRPRNAP